MTDLAVTIAGVPFDHLVYHFVLTYSNWETGTVSFSESFESLCQGLQNALWEPGGVPQVHRTDRLTTAVDNLGDRELFRRRYHALLAHYGLLAQAINVRQGNENGECGAEPSSVQDGRRSGADAPRQPGFRRPHGL
jgi:hypothetical protein